MIQVICSEKRGEFIESKKIQRHDIISGNSGGAYAFNSVYVFAFGEK